MKNASELLQLGKNIASAYLQNGDDLTESLTKVAVANSLTKEEISRVAEQANVETYLGLVNKTPDHYVQFDLANATNSFYKAASILNVKVDTDTVDSYDDLPEQPFSFSMYKQKSSGTEILTKEASATVMIESEISDLKDRINILQNEVLVKKAEISRDRDKSAEMMKQAILSGINFNNITNLVKLAAPSLGEVIIEDFKKDFIAECPFIDLEKVAETNLIPSKTSDLFQKLAQLDSTYRNMTEDINMLSEKVDRVNRLIEDNNAGDLVKLSGVVKELVDFGVKHPVLATATPALAGGYILGKKSKKTETNYLTRANVEQALLNKNS